MQTMVTQEQFEGVKDLLKNKAAAQIMKEHSDNLGKKYWSVDALNSLSIDQMALLLYNPDQVTVEPSLEDHLREMYKGAKNQDFADGVEAAATLYGIDPEIFEGLVEWVPEGTEADPNPQ
ncbi:hypothetical protein [Paenibacillus hubeiensis]|uniref:hypothetical protein n=1 Tax=Paenibacillus hubeiensis TaxID=3077330 RepID=UPI0031B9BDC9